MTTAEEATCDCCKAPVPELSGSGLCFACHTFQMFVSVIKAETTLSEDETFDLAEELQSAILSKLIERLRLPQHSLLEELLQTTEPTDKPHRVGDSAFNPIAP